MRIFLLVLVAALGSSSAPAAQLPKLVVVMAVDQFRGDYLTRFEHQFLPATGKDGKPGGFRFLLDKGAWFPAAHTTHSPNVTAVGHAAMLTGALPYLHGVVSNFWFDQALHDRFYCVEDAESRIIGGPGGGTTGSHTGRSPRTLLVSTVGDELKNAFGGKPRVVSVAIKDRAAILMGGHRADLALWYDDHNGAWVTSSYYLGDKKELPEWVTKWNAGRDDYMTKYVPSEWRPLLSDDQYAQSTPLPKETVGDVYGMGKQFPHAIDRKIPRFAFSPFGNSYTLSTALEAVEKLGLGHGDAPDMLTLSLSSFDILGHAYGPLSKEMQDTTLRLDRALAEFFAGLARAVPGGLANVVFVLTADHGVQPNPVFAEKTGLPGSAVIVDDFLAKANAFLVPRMGFDDGDKPVIMLFEDNVIFDHALFQKRNKDLAGAAGELVTWLRAQPYTAAAYTRAALLNGVIPPTTVALRMAASVHPERSGDVVFAMRPGHLSMDNFHDYGGTGHESPTAQDAMIPLVFEGAPFRAGHYYEDATMLDLAATLSAVLGIAPPNGNEGKVLRRALKADSAP